MYLEELHALMLAFVWYGGPFKSLRIGRVSKNVRIGFVSASVEVGGSVRATLHLDILRKIVSAIPAGSWFKEGVGLSEKCTLMLQSGVGMKFIC